MMPQQINLGVKYATSIKWWLRFKLPSCLLVAVAQKLVYTYVAVKALPDDNKVSRVPQTVTLFSPISPPNIPTWPSRSEPQATCQVLVVHYGP
jgi:hypothetical protein